MANIQKVVAALNAVLTVQHKYSQDLADREYKVTQDELTTHEHYLDEVDPIVKALGGHNFRVFLNDKTRFSDEERNILESAIRVLRSSMVPVALLKVVESAENKQKSLLMRRLMKSQ